MPYSYIFELLLFTIYESTYIDSYVNIFMIFTLATKEMKVNRISYTELNFM
jgi:hypothetical protein